MAGTAYRVVAGWRRQDAGQCRRFSNVDRGEFLAEVDLCGGRNAVGPLAKKHLVDEQRKNLFLRKLLFDFIGEEGFADFSRENPFARQEVVAGELLGECAAAAADFAADGKAECRSQDALVVDTRVHPETTVLRRDKGVHDVRRNLIEFDQHPAPFAYLFYKASVAAENPERNLQRDVADRLGFGQPRLHVIVGTNHRSCDRHGARQAQSQQRNQPAPATAAGFVNWSLRVTARVLHSPALLDKFP